MLQKLIVSSAVVLMILTGFAVAQDRTAVIISQSDYNLFGDTKDVERLANLERPLRSAGFSVVVRKNVISSRFGLAGRSVQAAVNGGDDVLIILAGHVVSNDRDAWLIATDSQPIMPFNVGRFGLSIGAVLDAVREDAGSVVVLIAQPATKIEGAEGLQIGLGDLDIPQGVSVLTGSAAQVNRVVLAGLLREGMSFEAVRELAGPDVRALGYWSRNETFLSNPNQTNNQFDGVSEAEVQAYLWSQAKQAGTARALERFLERFQSGPGVNEARRMYADLSKTPQERAREAEVALKLARSDRRRIQSDLTLLGFGTNGVDGIFGGGTRAAIRKWQAAENLDVTGFLDAAQIRAIEASAQVERDLIERLDAELWRDAQRKDTEESYQNYLAEYPKGLFADLAKGRLDRIKAARVAQQAQAEQAAWADAKNVDTVAAYNAFLKDHPDGKNAEAARERLKALQPQTPNGQAQEDRILANPIARLLAERQLAAAGFNPGSIDGIFDDRTRRAIRGFQKSLNLSETGYLTAQTLARLLAQ